MTTGQSPAEVSTNTAILKYVLKPTSLWLSVIPRNVVREHHVRRNVCIKLLIVLKYHESTIHVWIALASVIRNKVLCYKCNKIFISRFFVGICDIPSFLWNNYPRVEIHTILKISRSWNVWIAILLILKKSICRTTSVSAKFDRNYTFCFVIKLKM